VIAAAGSDVRRVEERRRFPAFTTESVTGYEPAFDAAVPEDHLAFDPPDGG
jgi:hypothetical protein